MYGSQEKILGQKVNVKFFTVDPYSGGTRVLQYIALSFNKLTPGNLTTKPDCQWQKKHSSLGMNLVVSKQVLKTDGFFLQEDQKEQDQETVRICTADLIV